MVAEERSFTRAAARLGLSPSSVSHAMRALEDRLDVKLLHRTTRSVSLTDAGERLLGMLRPAMADVTAAVDALGELRDRPAGRVRLTVHHGAAMSLFAPRLPEFARQHPGIELEISVDSGLVDIVAGRFDAGVRLGEQIARDMISVRIGRDERAAVVASPAYFRQHPVPRTPADLGAHRCLRYRHVSSRAIARWEFARGGRKLSAVVEGEFITNDGGMLLQAALGGMGLAYLWEDYVATHLASGALVRVLEDWCPPFSGNFLYYPSRRHVTPALRAVIEAFRYQKETPGPSSPAHRSRRRRPA